jgi:hypothetical protein
MSDNYRENNKKICNTLALLKICYLEYSGLIFVTIIVRLVTEINSPEASSGW